MIFTLRYGWARLPVVVAGFSLASVLAAGAQIVPSGDGSDAPTAEAAGPAVDVNDDDMKDIDVDKLDWSQLDVDASTLSIDPKSKARPPSQASSAPGASWSSSDNANGSSAVSVKQSLAAFLNTQVGADMTVTRQPQTLTGQQLLSEKLANGGSLPRSSGTAWAAITAPGVDAIWDKTTVEARVDPSQDQSKLGTSLSKSLPLNGQYSLTLENGYDVVEQGIVPVPGIIGRPIRNFETEQSARLSIAGTGTSFTAGQSLSSADDKWLRKIGAEQKLFGGVSVTGSIGETPLGAADKSLTAGYKQSW